MQIVFLSIAHFSAGFKKLFYEALQAGKSPSDIVFALGIDPNILGENRVTGLRIIICNETKAGKGFRDLNTYGKYPDCAMNPEAKIHLLEQKLA